MKNLIRPVAFVVLAAPAFAGHNNPWATANDVILEQYHTENQAQSINTPGEDEMRGVMVQRARGKLDPTVGKPDGAGIAAD
ncbi:hypothetical protein [Celeribacter arenosi]|uniref:Uncharacterized protein n=1 Tax=Celeribacter arenosi TaxID=792649 RepID=A0ABP7K838_9RHOB